jgi:Ni,Fe-hydrogenase III small subunit/Pyruvate/2-oxoacid:ferredoxin oxidoreductase delta subunit
VLKALYQRMRQGRRTFFYPERMPELPERFRGLPVIDATRCPEGCRDCAEACPTGAIAVAERTLRLDLGRCLFCTQCAAACPEQALRYTSEFRLAASGREALILGESRTVELACALDDRARRLFGRSLKLRQVSAGGCNGCEVEVNVLNTVVFDLARFGIQFVASPRHADGLVVTGPVTRHMREALRETYEAVPAPKIVIAVGACAISGGPYVDHPEASNGVAEMLPVDLFVPGCPPHPWTILDGLLRLVGRLEHRAQARG